MSNPFPFLTRTEALEIIYSAALRLRAELEVDSEHRTVRWVYDGASAVNKVQTLDAALACISLPMIAAPGVTKTAEERCDVLYAHVASRNAS